MFTGRVKEKEEEWIIEKNGEGKNKDQVTGSLPAGGELFMKASLSGPSSNSLGNNGSPQRGNIVKYGTILRAISV